MIYYYAQCDDETKIEVFNQMKRVATSQDQIWLDSINNSDQWYEMLKKLRPMDQLYIISLLAFAQTVKEMKQRFSALVEKDILLYTLDGEQIDKDLILETISYVNERGMYIIRMHQREGIQRALKNKELGKGTYGRPRIEIPADFEKNLRIIKEKKMTHEAYRAKLKWKRSTYYYLVREERKRWLKEEHDNDL